MCLPTRSTNCRRFSSFRSIATRKKAKLTCNGDLEASSLFRMMIKILSPSFKRERKSFNANFPKNQRKYSIKCARNLSKRNNLSLVDREPCGEAAIFRGDHQEDPGCLHFGNEQGNPSAIILAADGEYLYTRAARRNRSLAKFLHLIPQ